MIKLSNIIEKVNKRGIEVRPIDGQEEISIFNDMLRKHYLGGASKSVNIKLGIFADGYMVGIVAYGPPTYAGIAKDLNLESGEVYELRRFYTDENHKIYNLESQAVSLANDVLKEIKPQVRIVVTYADPNQGHLGRLYQATNAIYLGRGKGIGGKHKYIYIIGSASDKKATINKIKMNKQEYPKAELTEFEAEGFNLDEFLAIRSFAGKVRYANQKLRRLASGSARIIYEIDSKTVLKLAKNEKGLAQNEVEASLSNDYMVPEEIIAQVLEYDENNRWIVMERAKKISSARFKQLMDGIDISNFYYYIRNNTDDRRGHLFRVRPEVEEQLNDNEFAQGVIEMARNFDLEVGDFGRPSSFGEIDGRLVLTDYGLNKQVFAKYYDAFRR